MFYCVGVDDVRHSESIDARAALFCIHIVFVFGVHLLPIEDTVLLLEGGT